MQVKEFSEQNHFLIIAGTGNIGDPNVSIYIDTDIRNAVRRLLE